MTAAQLGNSARLAAQPLTGGGTPTETWVDAGMRFPVLDLGGCPELVVVGAHPDDETLGFGATAHLLAEAGVPTQIVSASDGGAAYPNQTLLQRFRLEQIRRAELHCAAGVMGLHAPLGLRLPDGQIAQHEERLADLLTEILAPKPAGTWCAATWRGDGHPDHEAVGRAAAVAAERTGAVLLEYPVWMWHWALPDDGAVPWGRARSVPLPTSAVERKKVAAQCFQSQFVGQASGDEPVLPAYMLPRILAVGEVVFL
jgi:LmbE family N-acetylglucosaminyl deacetylase